MCGLKGNSPEKAGLCVWAGAVNYSFMVQLGI